MKIIADTHTHTLASTHAYSTILENARYASEIGLKYLAVTDHGPKMADAPHIWHFHNLQIIPDELFGVKILKGVEANILNKDGTLDITDFDFNFLNWAVASFHSPCCEPLSIKDATNAYLNVAKNRNIDVIGHSGLEQYKYDFKVAIKAFKEYNKLVEINNASYLVRKESQKNCVEIARLCKKYEVPIVVNSDAHFAYKIGNVEKAMEMLMEIDFPKQLIINSSLELFEEYLNNRK